MTPDTTVRENAGDLDSLLSRNVRVPRNVVYRTFPSETVVLNLETGKYHGLNATAGRMLEELERAACVQDAAAALAETYGQPLDVLERDLCELCQSLLARGLIEVDSGELG
ncbi:MAG TPA: PqqD family protein [Solirubrobacteraceae bacterium]|nr:PqqD family protein [Solirubrobacteraceae bacterium]